MEIIWTYVSANMSFDPADTDENMKFPRFSGDFFVLNGKTLVWEFTNIESDIDLQVIIYVQKKNLLLYRILI